MSDNADAEKYAVLDQAAQSMAGAEDAGPPGEHGATAPPSAPAAPGLLREASGDRREATGDLREATGDLREAVGDLTGYLHAYYRHVAAEDVAAFGAGRLAAVASQHAALAARRAQGRPLVRVTAAAARAAAGPAGAIAAFGPVRVVVDIVTDDMPFLVDSVTMELNRHQADINLIVHPRLVVYRDVTGALHGVSGSLNGARPAPGEITESWIHVEIASLGDRVPLPDLETALRRVLDDVRVTVEDQPKMTAAAASLAVSVAGEDAGVPLPGRAGPPSPDSADTEAGELLAWLADGHFIFLGYREYDLVPGDDGEALRAVPGTGLGFLRHDRQRSESFAALPADIRAKARDPHRLVLARGNSRSTVYRNKYLDSVSVKKLGRDGRVIGEWRFLGLYTYAAYTESIARIPVLRRKLADVLAAAGDTPDSHDGNDLIEILENYPREELFQISTSQLTEIAAAVLRLRERKQTRLFLRRDAYGRYMSCLIYLPRDRYTTAVRLHVQEILRTALHGASVDYSAMVGESALARLHVVVRAERGRPVPAVDAAALERRIVAAVRSWDEDLAEEALRTLGEQRARLVLDQFAAAIPDTYKTEVTAADAVGDLSRILLLRESGDSFAVQLREDDSPGSGHWRLRVYRSESPIILSDVLPQLQHMGVKVADEHPYEFGAGAGAARPEAGSRTGPFWIYDFGLRAETPAWRQRPRGDGKEQFEQALCALWRGEIEDDGFNALVLDAGLAWRDIVVLRAYARYLRQAGNRFSQGYIQRVLRSNTTVTRLLARLFASRFDPAHRAGEAERSEAIVEEIRGELDDVVSLDHDRILQSYLALIGATLRTNHYRTAGSGGSGGAGPAARPAPRHPTRPTW